MKFDEFKRNVINWAKERKIIPNSNNKAQYIKLIEELGELALGIRKQDEKIIKDSIGDVAVVLVILAALNKLDIEFGGGAREKDFKELSYFIGLLGHHLQKSKFLSKNNILAALNTLEEIAKENGFDFMECCELAWNEIKDRKGVLRPDGIFVKEADLGGEND